MKRHLSFWDWTKLISPVWARLLARIPHGRPLTDAEIALKSGLTMDRVFLIQHMTDWSSVSMVEAEMFLRGCGINFCDSRQMDRVRWYLPRPGKKTPVTFKYLRISPEWNTKYRPLMLRARASLDKITGTK